MTKRKTKVVTPEGSDQWTPQEWREYETKQADEEQQTAIIKRNRIAQHYAKKRKEQV